MTKSLKRSRSAAGCSKQSRAAAQVRIIGGVWRGRKLPVPDTPGLRPTGDRVRETLFNWLQSRIAGACCLDLYAGSGALGLEAASRGAGSVTLIETADNAVSSLRQQTRVLQAGDRVQVIASTAEAFLDCNKVCFDVVFVDPPFTADCHGQILKQLCNGHLAPAALVYVEAPKDFDLHACLPSPLVIFRQQVFGAVKACLLTSN